MNDKPITAVNQMVVRRVKQTDDEGKEAEAACRIYKTLLDAGFDRQDINRITEMSRTEPTILNRLLAVSKGLIPEERTKKFINLARHPERTGQMSPCDTLVLDTRLGTWLNKAPNLIGDRHVTITRAHGYCIQGGMFNRDTLTVVVGPDVIDLNSQAAYWYQEHQSDLVRFFFGDAAHIRGSGNDWANIKIMFLGTIWRRRAISRGNAGPNLCWDLCAPTLSYFCGCVHCGLEPLPEGIWPDDYFLAVLVP